MTERGSIVVPEDLEGVRLDRTLALLTGISRSDTRRMIDAGEVWVGDTVATKSTLPRVGDTIEYVLPMPATALEPEPVSFDVVFDRGEVLVVNKPAGLVVHPGAGNQKGTLAHGLAYRYPEIAALGEEYRWGLVHRLDRDTSGLLLVARTADMHGFLQDQLKLRRIGRTYLALVSGHLGAATGTIEAPIGRDPLRPTRMAIVRDGRPARTHYRRSAEWESCSLVEIELETGRTHQIRVHFESIGHGVVGDPTYGRTLAEAGDPGRVWLHARRLRFALPDGQEHEVEVDLPADLAASLAELGEPSGH
jgi:23S rRNA pseudouridine1911/1915/1917 synthase